MSTAGKPFFVSEPPTDGSGDLRRRAEEVVRRIASLLEERGEHDPRRVADAAGAALISEANLELRRTIAKVRTPLEQASTRAGSSVVLSRETVARIVAALDRAGHILASHLERDRVEALLIQIRPERFDLGSAFLRRLAARGIEPGTPGALVRVGRAEIHGDREKVLDALGHIVSRFWFEAAATDRLVVEMGPKDGGVRGFVGLEGLHLRKEQLLEELSAPFSLEGAELDLGYARAVLERHGGQLIVDEREGAVGFGFWLPPCG